MNSKQAKRLRKAAVGIALLGNASQGKMKPKSSKEVYKEMKEMHKSLPSNERTK